MPRGSRDGYDRDAFGSSSRYQRWEDEIVAGLPKSGDQVYTPYSCTLFDIRDDGTAATDIDHIVALAEAYDSGLDSLRFREFAADTLNLTIAVPTVNRNQKSDKDAAGWSPTNNRGWFAAKVVAVKAEVRDVPQSGRAGLAGRHVGRRLKPHGGVQPIRLRKG